MEQPEAPLKWEQIDLPAGEWTQLDQLWFCFIPMRGEFLVSYCYGEPGPQQYQQLGKLKELRLPFTTSISTVVGISDRAIVARPVQAIHLPRQSSMTLYVGTSLWFRLMHQADPILDIPIVRLSDSWFGPDTQRGEICYASKTHARLSLAGSEPNPFKAITPIIVRNRTSKPLIIDRLNIPIQHLSLYRDGNRYWTSGIKLTMADKSTDAEVKISPAAPEDCQAPALISGPREPLASGILRKTMEFLLG